MKNQHKQSNKKIIGSKCRNAMLLVFILFTFRVTAQVVINIPQNGPTVYSVQDMAQIVLNNTSGTSISSCYAEITCNEDNGNKVFEMKTPLMTLVPGNNTLGYSNLITAQTTGFSDKFNQMEQTGALPSGRYMLCINIYRQPVAQIIGTGCSSIQSATAGGVFLLSPLDEEIIETEYPTLSWSGLDMRGRDMSVKYNIRICELYSYQNYSEAIVENPPLVYEQDIPGGSFTYPSSAPQLDKDKKYVWQVEAIITVGISSSKLYSEIWMFQFKKDKPNKTDKKKKSEAEQYAYLTKTLSGSSHVFDKTINFRYDNEAKDSLLTYIVYDLNNHVTVLSNEAKQIVLQPRVNYISLPITKEMVRNSKNSKQAFKGQYLLQVRNSRQENWKLKFVLVKPKKDKS